MPRKKNRHCKVCRELLPQPGPSVCDGCRGLVARDTGRNSIALMTLLANPARSARLEKYAARASLGLPLFEDRDTPPFR